MAIEATAGNLKQLEHRMHNIRKREEGRLGEAEAIAASLQGKKVTVFAKVGESGRLFGSITSNMIVDAIDEQLDVEVDRRKMDVHGHIKDVGKHTVMVQVYREVKAEVIVDVVAEGTVVEAETPDVVVDQPVAELAEDAVETEAEQAEEFEVHAVDQLEATEQADDDVAAEVDGDVAGELESE
jgi:large subunit ribosomal protein L9